MVSTQSKVWFVTGASSGMGRAMVIYLLEQGNKVVATMRNTKDLSNLALKYSEDQLLVLKLDVSSTSDITAAFSQALDKFSRIDVVYSNAGYATLGEVEATQEDVARNMFDVNFWGSTNVAKEAIRVFRDVNSPKGGRFLQVSSVVGISAMAGFGFYSASKHAVEGVMQSFSSELHPSWNIKITLLEFGTFKTRAVDAKSMIFAPVHPAYTAEDLAGTGVRNFFVGGLAEAMGSDPSKASREIYKIASDDTVGLRVPLGNDSIQMLSGQLETVKKDVEAAGKWSVDLSVDA